MIALLIRENNEAFSTQTYKVKYKYGYHKEVYPI